MCIRIEGHKFNAEKSEEFCLCYPGRKNLMPLNHAEWQPEGFSGKGTNKIRILITHANLLILSLKIMENAIFKACIHYI